MIIRGAIAVGLFVALAAFAAPPRLRAGTRIAYLTHRHGQPYHIYKALFRLSALSNVDPTTCFGHPTGRNACYLTADERDTNLDEFEGLLEWQQDHVHEWFVILESKANPGTIDVQHMLHTIFGTNLPHRFSTMTEDDFKAAIGAAERSLNEEEFGDEDARPTFDWIDKNGDGLLSVLERGGIVTQDCEEQAEDTIVCRVYTSLLEQFMPSSDMTYEQWKAEIITEGASVHEEISAQFASYF